MKTGNLLLLLTIIATLGAIFADRYYLSQFEKNFRELEEQRIITSNKLATAKIVYENLNHVRDLVFKNMDFPGQKQSTVHESYFFDFITTCINDLKLQLVSVKPLRPVVKGPVTTYGYDIVIEGDFFKFGELCAKFENSRRIASLESFSVDLITESQGKVASPGTKGIRVTMRVNTYRIKKETLNLE